MNNPVEATAPEVLADRYRLDQVISKGSHAQIWRGFDLQSQRAVVVKIFKPDLVGSVEQFESNLRRLSSIRFPGLIPILDDGTKDGTCFVVYELFEVGSLREYVGRQFISTQQITRWMIDLGEALEFAHSEGVVHQNIKPANVMIDLDGHAQLSDFGLFPLAIRDDQPGFSLDELKYLAPEQLEGKPADARSDLYSLGVVMHELLTGRLPYRNSDLRSIRFEILRGAHPDSADIPRELRHICHKVLAREPVARYLSADEFVNEVRKTLAGASTRRWAFATAGVVLFLLGFGVSAWWMGDGRLTNHAEQAVEANWIERIRSLPANKQVTAVVEKLRTLNQQFDGEVQETIENGVVVELILSADQVKDLSPLKALSGLKSLTCFGTYSTQSNGQLFDLSPLRGLRLSRLIINDNDRIRDLTPLEGMPLQFLHCGRTGVSDLSPLKKSPLSVVICRYTNVTDLSPLIGLPLKEIFCDHTGINDLSPLEGMPLEELHCEDTPVTNLAPLRGLPLKVLDCYRTLISDLHPLRGNANLNSLNILSTNVEDLSPIKDLPNIKLLWCDLNQESDRELLHSLKTLKFINDNPVSVFWQEDSHSEP